MRKFRPRAMLSFRERNQPQQQDQQPPPQDGPPGVGATATNNTPPSPDRATVAKVDRNSATNLTSPPSITDVGIFPQESSHHIEDSSCGSDDKNRSQSQFRFRNFKSLNSGVSSVASIDEDESGPSLQFSPSLRGAPVVSFDQQDNDDPPTKNNKYDTDQSDKETRRPTASSRFPLQSIHRNDNNSSSPHKRSASNNNPSAKDPSLNPPGSPQKQPRSPTITTSASFSPSRVPPSKDATIRNLIKQKHAQEESIHNLQKQVIRLQMQLKDQAYESGAEIAKIKLENGRPDDIDIENLEREFKSVHDVAAANEENAVDAKSTPMESTRNDGLVLLDPVYVAQLKTKVIQGKIQIARMDKQLLFVKGICNTIVEGLREELADMECEKERVELDMMNQLAAFGGDAQKVEEELATKLTKSEERAASLDKANKEFTAQNKILQKNLSEVQSEHADMEMDMMNQLSALIAEKNMLQNEYKEQMNIKDELVASMEKTLNAMQKNYKSSGLFPTFSMSSDGDDNDEDGAPLQNDGDEVLSQGDPTVTTGAITAPPTPLRRRNKEQDKALYIVVLERLLHFKNLLHLTTILPPTQSKVVTNMLREMLQFTIHKLVEETEPLPLGLTEKLENSGKIDEQFIKEQNSPSSSLSCGDVRETLMVLMNMLDYDLERYQKAIGVTRYEVRQMSLEKMKIKLRGSDFDPSTLQSLLTNNNNTPSNPASIGTAYPNARSERRTTSTKNQQRRRSPSPSPVRSYPDLTTLASSPKPKDHPGDFSLALLRLPHVSQLNKNKNTYVSKSISSPKLGDKRKQLTPLRRGRLTMMPLADQHFLSSAHANASAAAITAMESEMAEHAARQVIERSNESPPSTPTASCSNTTATSGSKNIKNPARHLVGGLSHAKNCGKFVLDEPTEKVDEDGYPLL